MSLPPRGPWPTLDELRGEGRLLSAAEARRRLAIKRRRDAAAERAWMRARPHVGPLVWSGGGIGEFAAQADDASIRAAFFGEHAPISAPQRRCLRLELASRARERGGGTF